MEGGQTLKIAVQRNGLPCCLNHWGEVVFGDKDTIYSLEGSVRENAVPCITEIPARQCQEVLTREGARLSDALPSDWIIE
jgi:hypothetical protein